MVIIEVAVMWGTYTNKRLNLIIIAASALARVAFFLLIRRQILVGDAQFPRSMIPHHAGAILMCNEATIQDPGDQVAAPRSLRASKRRSNR